MTGITGSETGGKQPRVLLVYTGYSSFVQADEDLLGSISSVTCYQFRPVRGAMATILELLRQLFFLFSRWQRYDLILVWFADTHAFLPVWYGRLRKINTAVILGGFDAVSFPELKYGLFCSNRIRQFLGKYAIRNAGYLLPVDASLVENINRYADVNDVGIPQGIKNFVSGIRGKIIPTPTGYDPEYWKSNPQIPRNNSVVTVGSVNNRQRWILKGGSFLQEIAREMPETAFHIYGVSEAMIRELQQEDPPPNLYLHGYVTLSGLPDIYSRHAVYAQFSLSEGLPNSLCEAMLCGCIPAGSAVNGIPEAIGDDRLVLRKRERQEAVELIRLAQEIARSETGRYRERIMERFTPERRMNVFRDLLLSGLKPFISPVSG